MQKLKKFVGLSSVAAAFVFLFNPNLNLVDILPDFIGYIILCLCLSQLADLNEDIAEARKKFGIAVGVDIAKLFSMFIVFGSSQTDEQNAMLLLVSFSFAVIECVVLIPAYIKMFSGFINLGYRFENNSVLRLVNKNKRKNRTEKILSFTVFFVILKAAAYTLPEFSVLATHTYNESSNTVYLYDFVGLLRGFSIMVALVVGAVWLIRVIRYFSLLKKDKVFIDALGREYTERILPRDSLFVRKTIKFIFILFGLAAFLCLDFRVEYFNLIPDTVPALLLIIAAFSAKKYVPYFAKYFVPFLLYAMLSLVAQLFEYRFFSEFFYSAVVKNDDAYNAYVSMLMTSLLDAAGFVLAAFGIAYVMKWAVANHTGFFVPDVSLRVDDKIKKVHQRLMKKIYGFYVAAFLCVASDIFYDFGAKDLGFAGIVNVLCTLIFFGCFYSVSSEIYDEVESKYMLE